MLSVGWGRQKQTDFEARQKLRGEELAAIAEAIGILSGDAVAGASAKHYGAISSENIDGKFFLQVAVDRRPVVKEKVRVCIAPGWMGEDGCCTRVR